MRKASITIDRHALNHNLTQVKSALSGSTKVLAMVKANAYGHGIEACLPALEQANGLGVACFSEALQIRQLGWEKTLVLIEGVFSESEWIESIASHCQSVIHDQQQVQWAVNHLPEGDSVSRTLWLKVNTGMNRLGFEPAQLVDVAQCLVKAGYKLILTSHFANADVPSHPSNADQINTFKAALKQLHDIVDPSIQASLCNSAGFINYPECHFDWVRPGIMIYGSSPLDNITAESLHLKPVMTFQACIMAIHNISAGTPIGYGSRYVADRPLVKGVVSIGYGDGYPRVVDSTAWVSVHSESIHTVDSPPNDTSGPTTTHPTSNITPSLNQTNSHTTYKCPVIGRVAMDMITVDLTDVPHPKVGDTVTLWGDATLGMPSVDEIARSANTLGYELLCRMTQRPSRYAV